MPIAVFDYEFFLNKYYFNYADWELSYLDGEKLLFTDFKFLGLVQNILLLNEFSKLYFKDFIFCSDLSISSDLSSDFDK